MYTLKNYNWETQRINAFLIMNNKLYEARTHLECFAQALNIDVSRYCDTDCIEQVEEDLEIQGFKNKYDYILGEVANINGQRSVICVGSIKIDRDIISKYYKDISYENYYD